MSTGVSRKGRKVPDLPPGPTARRAWEDGGGVDDDGTPNPVPDPQLPLPARTYFRPGSDKVATFAARHAAGQSLWHPQDLPGEQPIDFIQAFTELGGFMREVALAERDLRWLANGVSVVPGPRPGDPPQYRAQIWDPGQNDHIEVGRAKTRAEALDLIIDWASRHLRINIRFEVPLWMKLITPDLLQAHAEQHGRAWDDSDDPAME